VLALLSTAATSAFWRTAAAVAADAGQRVGTEGRGFPLTTPAHVGWTGGAAVLISPSAWGRCDGESPSLAIDAPMIYTAS
jgi:hypothetical protein